MRQYDAVIFDNDGVLTKPTARLPRRRAIKWTLREFGVDRPTERDIDALYTVTSDDVKAVAQRYELNPAALLERREMNTAAIQYGMLRNGRKSLYNDVKVLCDISVPVGIVSNNQHRTIEHIVDLFDLDALVDTYHGRSPTLAGIDYRKPDPTYLQRAIIDLGVDQPMYVGDSNVDLIAAERAGIDCAFVRRDHRSEYELTREPTYEIDSLSEIRSILDRPLQRH